MDKSILSNKCFKVPKLKSKSNLENIPIDSCVFKTEIYPKISYSYIKQKQSEKMLRFSNCWLINNSEAEESFIKRRQQMRKENTNPVESIGFLFVKSERHFCEIVNVGRIQIGNVLDSRLATGSMGVSICQHADIYHPGIDNAGVPKSGFLLLVKFFKGKINYVKYDDSPMDPQPQYDCHMLKSCNVDQNCNISKAFHKTQIFLYEYTENIEIVEYPSQILPFAVVQFQLNGPYIYRAYVQPKQVQQKCIKSIQVAPLPISVKIKRPSRFKTVNPSVHQINSTFNIPCQLFFEKQNTYEHSSDLKITCTVYSYLINPVVFPQLYTSRWYITDIIEAIEFEKELKLFQFHLEDKITKSHTDLLDPLSHDIIVSINSATLLTISENQSDDIFLLTNDTTIPKFITYLRLVPDDSPNSRISSTRLIDHFTNSKTIARISLGSIDSQYKTMLFIFPDGKLSQKLGIPSIKADEIYFHGLLLHFQHPEFTMCHLNKDSSQEKYIYFNGLSMFRKQSVQAKFSTIKPLISNDLLKKTCAEQAVIQRKMFSYLLKPNCTNAGLLKYSNLSCDRSFNPIINEMSVKNNNNVVPLDCSNTLVLNKQSNDTIQYLEEDMVLVSDGSDDSVKEDIQQNHETHTKSIINKEFDKPSNCPNSKSTQPQISKEKKLLKSKKKERKQEITKDKSNSLKMKLYDMLKKPINELEMGSSVQRKEIDSEVLSIDLIDKTDDQEAISDFDCNDLIPVRGNISFDICCKGSFDELIFLNENYARISNSEKLLFIDQSQAENYRRPYKFEKMWMLDRFIFRKMRHFPGISFYQG